MSVCVCVRVWGGQSEVGGGRCEVCVRWGGGGWGLPKFVSAYLLKEAAGAGGTPWAGGITTL